MVRRHLTRRFIFRSPRFGELSADRRPGGQKAGATRLTVSAHPFVPSGSIPGRLLPRLEMTLPEG